MNATRAETNGFEVSRWIGDVRDVGKDDFLALLYSDEEAFAKRWETACVEIPRDQIAPGLWRCVQQCAVFHCDVVIDTSAPADEQPVFHAVEGIEFDSGFSVRMNKIALSSLQGTHYR